MTITHPPPAQRLLPEWAPQASVLFTWPRRCSAWAPEQREAVAKALATAAAFISRRQDVLLVAEDHAHANEIRARIVHAGGTAERCRFEVAPSDDVWVRDHGPLTVRDAQGALRLLDFTFDGWGGKHPADADDRLVRRLHARGAFGTTPLTRLPLVLEGGAIDTDGEGTLLTTARCLLDPRRNVGITRERMEQQLREHLGVDRVLWLEHGWLAGDDTDGHVDMLARFCSPDTIAHVVCTDPADEHHAELSAMAAELAAFRDRSGQPYRLVPLPLPAARRDRDGARLPASHANFLITNDAVLVPTYDDPLRDEWAVTALRRVFPGRTVEPFPALPLIHQSGSLHCATMQLPRGAMPPLSPPQTTEDIDE